MLLGRVKMRIRLLFIGKVLFEKKKLKFKVFIKIFQLFNIVKL